MNYYNPMGAVELSQTKVFRSKWSEKSNHLLLSNQGWVGAERAGLAPTLRAGSAPTQLSQFPPCFGC